MATKKCPFCAEEIQAEAIICRYCGSNLGSAQQFNTAPAGMNYQNAPQAPMGYQPAPQPVQPRLFLPAPNPGDMDRIALLFELKGDKYNTHGVDSVIEMCNVIRSLSLGEIIGRVQSAFPETPVFRERALPRVSGMMRPGEQILFFTPRGGFGKPENDAFMLTDRAFYSFHKKEVLTVEIKDISSITKLLTVNTWYINCNLDIVIGGMMEDAIVGDIMAVISLMSGLYNGTFQGSGFKVLLQGWDYDV